MNYVPSKKKTETKETVHVLRCVLLEFLVSRGILVFLPSRNYYDSLALKTLSVSLSSVTYQFQHGVVAYLRFSFHVKMHEMASWWLFSTTDHHTWRWGERESAIERKMQYFPIANRFDRMHHSTLKWADTKRKYTCVDMEMLGSK